MADLKPQSVAFAKTTRPAIASAVPRERLFARLDGTPGRTVAWISGPPGAGKTTLAASYVEARRYRCLWYQVDADDADVATFFHYLGHAARKLDGAEPLELPGPTALQDTDLAPNFGLLADLSHFPLLGERPEDAIPLVKAFPLHFHLGNCVMRDRRHPAYGDLQPRFGIPGGEVDVPQVRSYFRLLLDHGLLNPQDPPVVSVEVRPLLSEEYSEVIIANAKLVIRQAWADL